MLNNLHTKYAHEFNNIFKFSYDPEKLLNQSEI